MKVVSVPLLDKIKQSVTIESKIRLIAEWNHNRYTPVTVTNPGTAEENEFDNDLFPLSSIAKPERPTRGVVKAFAGDGTPDGYVTSGYKDVMTGARYVTSTKESKYKYWVSPGESGLTPFAISGVSPTVVYSSTVFSNKIRITFENSYASPGSYTVYTSTDGTTWNSAASNVAPDSNGVVELYHQGAGVWSTTVTRSNPLTLKGVRVVVSNMQTSGVRLGLIELGLRLESDISDHVVSWSSDMSMSDISFVAPIGRASSNSGSVVLSNANQLFINNNPASPFYKLLGKNAELRLDLGINIGTTETPNYEYVRQFTMRSLEWQGQGRDGTTVSLVDASEYLQSVKPNPALYQEMTVGEIIWRVLDSVGFSYWQYDPVDGSSSTLVPVFYTDGEETVWEVISQLAEVTQTAVFFDEYGVLKIMPRQEAYNLTKPIDWAFDAVPNGSKLPDIKMDGFSVQYDFEANSVDINYTPTALSEESASGIRPMETVWEPEGTVTLRSSNLVKTMGASDTSFYITAAEANVWPYTGTVQVEGEFIKYDAKEYSFYNASGVLTREFIISEDERVARDKLYPTLAYQNSFTGRFRTSLANRGLWNTQAMAHDINLSNWNSHKYRTGTGTVRTWAGGFISEPNNSLLRIKTNSTFASNSWYVNTIGSNADQMPTYYGTRFKIEPGGQGCVGIVIAAGTNDSGLYLDIQSTEGISASSRTTYGHEISLYLRYSDGTFKRLTRGAQVDISKGVWYDVDFKIIKNGTTWETGTLINGVNVMMSNFSTSLWNPAIGDSGRHGLFTRGNTDAVFEYFYSWSMEINDSFDDATWWNRIYGGYQSNQFDSEVSYGSSRLVRLRTGKTYSTRVSNSARRLEEFGPVVHEVREFDVKFNVSPAVYSQIYFSNESQVICPEYNSTPFGASFVLANISRDNAVVNGEDTLTFGSENSVEQRFLIYGRTFVADEDQRTYTVKNDQSIVERGEVSVEISSKWIQSESEAKALGEWITYHWAGGSDQSSIEAFGNPVLQIGDLVSINYPDLNLTPATDQYFIVGISQNYDVEGLSTKYDLRRRKI